MRTVFSSFSISDSQGKKQNNYINYVIGVKIKTYRALFGGMGSDGFKAFPGKNVKESRKIPVLRPLSHNIAQSEGKQRGGNTPF